MKNKIIYFLVGAFLIIFNYQNRITTIDETTLDLIEEINTYNTEKLWPEFKNKDYMKDIRYNFSKEFRYDHGKIIKKTPDQPVASIEALKEGNKPLIKAVPFEKFRNITDQGASTKASLQSKYKSVIIHESFHCFQMDHGLSEVVDILDNNTDYNNPAYDKFIIVCKKLDEDKTYKKLWEEEYKALLTLYENKDASLYKNARDKRLSYVKVNFPDYYEYFVEMENYKEFIEGTARFVEENIWWIYQMILI